MYVDALVVGAVVAELQHLVGGRIQQVVMPTSDSVGLEVYQAGVRHQLLLSANSNYARLHLVPTKLTRGPGADAPLLLLLRKYVRGGRITRLECPPLERVVTLSITKMPTPRNQAPDDDDDDEILIEPRHCELTIEIIGKSSNIVLVDDSNVVLESVRHFIPGRSQRPIMPRGIYELPPRQHKRDPRQASASEIAALAGDTLARALVSAYNGVSPQTSREVAARVLGRSAASISPDTDVEAVAATLCTLTSGAEQQPSLARDADGVPVAVAPFWLHQHPHVESQPSVNVALATAFAQVDQVTAHAQTRDALAEQVEDLHRRATTKVDQLRTQLARADQLERLRWEGEMIFGYLHTLKPGQEELLLDTAVITLNPQLSGVENAQVRFREYDKAKGALEDVPRLLVQAEAQAAYLRETIDLLRLAESYAEIEQFERELSDQGLLKKPSKKHKPKAGGKSTVRRGPMRLQSADGLTIYVGRSAAQNDEVTFKIGQPNDYWLHARGRTGGHVIVRMQGDDLPPATLERAAQLAAYYSSARNDGVVEVDLARRKHVRRVKDGPPGLVRYEAERTVRVAPVGNA